MVFVDCCNSVPHGFSPLVCCAVSPAAFGVALSRPTSALCAYRPAQVKIYFRFFCPDPAAQNHTCRQYYPPPDAYIMERARVPQPEATCQALFTAAKLFFKSCAIGLALGCLVWYNRQRIVRWPQQAGQRTHGRDYPIVTYHTKTRPAAYPPCLRQGSGEGLPQRLSPTSTHRDRVNDSRLTPPRTVQ